MDRDAIMPVLSRSDMLVGLDDAALSAMLTAAKWRQVKAGTTLHSQDDPPTHLYLVGSGLVKMTQLSPGGAQLTICFLGPGEIVGCAAVFQQFPYPVTASVVEEGVVLVWPATRLFELMKQYPQLMQNALNIVGFRARDFVQRLGEVANKRVEQRIASAILRIARQTGEKVDNGGVEVSFTATRRDLAEMTGATYFTVSRTLSAWKKLGIVDSGRRRIIVKSPHRLFEIAEDL